MSTMTLWTELEKNVASMRNSFEVRRSMQNAVFSVIDYVAQPMGMLIATPFLVHSLGLRQYGLWMIVTTVTSSVALLSMGFGDATIKYVSKYRSLQDDISLRRVVRGTLALNFVLGTLFGSIIYSVAPFAVLHIFKIEPELRRAAIVSLQISAAIILCKSLEIVFVSTLRALEEYGSTVRISVVSRFLVILGSVLVAAKGFGVVTIMVVALLISLLGLFAQAVSAGTFVGFGALFPSFSAAALREIVAFGCFSWIQALSGLLFIHADRLLIAALLGTSAVAYYTICVQATQPIHGLISAAFNFLFPRISHYFESKSFFGLHRAFRVAAGINIGAVLLVSIPLAVFSKAILRVWMGSGFAASSHFLFAVLTIGYAILALNVVPHYTLLGIGEVRYVSATNALGGLLSLAATACMLPTLGLIGAGFGRLLYGPAVSLNVLRILNRFSKITIQERILA